MRRIELWVDSIQMAFVSAIASMTALADSAVAVTAATCTLIKKSTYVVFILLSICGADRFETNETTVWPLDRIFAVKARDFFSCY